MAGQTTSNEDSAVRRLTLEVFGCKSDPAPVCGDGGELCYVHLSVNLRRGGVDEGGVRGQGAIDGGAQPRVARGVGQLCCLQPSHRPV